MRGSRASSSQQSSARVSPLLVLLPPAGRTSVSTPLMCPGTVTRCWAMTEQRHPLLDQHPAFHCNFGFVCRPLTQHIKFGLYIS